MRIKFYSSEPNCLREEITRWVEFAIIDAQNTPTFRFLYIDPSLSQVPVLSTVEVGLAVWQVGVSLRHLRRLGRSFVAM